MKKLILTLFLILLSLIIIGQDVELFNYVNIYRVNNGLHELKWSDKLLGVSKKNTKNMAELNTVTHSGENVSEVSFIGNNISLDSIELVKLYSFIKKEFGVEFKDLKRLTSKDKKILTKMLIVYNWHNSVKHRSILLSSEITEGSCDTIINGYYVLNQNFVIIDGVKYYYNEVPSYYEVQYMSTMSLR